MLGHQRITVEGKQFVLLEESEYERLSRLAGEAVDDADLPPLPKPGPSGRYPAVEYARVSIARDLIRERKSVGLTQAALARLTGLRQETISRLESGKHTATTRTVDRITRVIEARRQRPRRAKRAAAKA